MSELEVRVRHVCDECEGMTTIGWTAENGDYKVRDCESCVGGWVEQWMPLVEVAHRGYRLLERL